MKFAERKPISLVTVVGALVIMGVLLLAFAILLLTLSRNSISQQAPSETSWRVIPASVLTTQPGNGNAPDTQPTLTPTLLPGQFGVGAYVQIYGTGGDGLRLRNEPGTDKPPLFLGMEAEVFRVADGPRDSGGYTWWFLAAPYDETRKGWAVQNYLSLVEKQPQP